MQNGREVPTCDYPRYDNPYVEAAFPAGKMHIRAHDHELNLDWQTLRREVAAVP